jgi:RHS repeat-associated protein
MTADYYTVTPRALADYYPFGMQMPGRTYIEDPKYRYGFNGQERVDEISGTGNHNTAEYWEYDTRLGRRWNLDPKPNTSVSAYACLFNNPITNIDVLGDTAFRFNSKGYYLGKFIDGKKEWSLQVVTSEEKIKDKIITHLDIHHFNDPDNDVTSMKSLVNTYGKEVKFLYQKSESDIHNYMNESGATSSDARNSEWDYAYHESKVRMDFWAVHLASESEAGGIATDDVNNDRGAFYIFDGSGTVYNTMDAGNYLWGGAMKNLDFSEFITRLGAHWNNATNDTHSDILDSPSDQKAISNGYNKTKIYPDYVPPQK